MSAIVASFEARDLGGIISMSLVAGKEIEKSRLDRVFDIDKIKNFGSLLKKKTIVSDEGRRKRIANADYAAPMHRLYVHSKQQDDVSLENILEFIEKLARQFEEFEPNLEASEKTKLVKICAQLHHFLSDELRDDEEVGRYGWWH